MMCVSHLNDIISFSSFYTNSIFTDKWNNIFLKVFITLIFSTCFRFHFRWAVVKYFFYITHRSYSLFSTYFDCSNETTMVGSCWFIHMRLDQICDAKLHKLFIFVLSISLSAHRNRYCSNTKKSILSPKSMIEII